MPRDRWANLGSWCLWRSQVNAAPERSLQMKHQTHESVKCRGIVGCNRHIHIAVWTIVTARNRPEYRQLGIATPPAQHRNFGRKPLERPPSVGGLGARIN